MPNRILKESICASENIDQLTPFAEIAFYRLMVNCDDYGRMDARAKILKSRLFPLKDIEDDQMMKALDELQGADLISIYHVDGKPYLQMKTWDKHQQVRAKRSKYPSANDNTCNQLIANDSKCPRNPIQSESLSESLSESELITANEARKIQLDHDTLIGAAENAGFKMSNDVSSELIALYALHGMQKVMDGLKSCVEHGVPTLAYLKACLTGKPKKANGKTVNAQQYSQREYEDEQAEAMRRMIKAVNS